MYKNVIKRILDVFLSAILLIILSPLLLVIYILVKADSKGPFLFVQKRLGYHEQIFNAYKIRTMTHKIRAPQGQVYGTHPDVTKVGFFLRKYKIDELPQLINIFLGDMSFVGPRPGLPEHLKTYNELAKMRLNVRPGLTGLAQVNGNIYLTWPERWIYDELYVKQVSFKLDISIIVKTFLILIKGEDKFLKKPNA